MSDDELDRLRQYAENGQLDWDDHDRMVALAHDVDTAESSWDFLALLDRDEQELYGRMHDLLDDGQRIDSPESDGEGSWEGPDFGDADDVDADEEDWV